MITYKIAHDYVRKGWSVFPVNLSQDSNGKILKKPAVAWKMYQDRLPTEEELHKWFDIPRFNGIGVVTGKISRIVVVDDDSRVDDIKFDSALVSKTISGGRHYYYRWTEHMANDAGIDDKPLDFRGDGGFVVLPPSRLNNKSYTWEKEVDTMFLTEIPKDLKNQLKVRKAPTATVSSKPMQSELPTASEGTRNDTASRVAGMLHRNISKKLWQTVGWETFKNWNQSNCTPPLDERELLTTWKSIEAIDLRNHQESQTYKILKGKEAVEEYSNLMEQYGEGISTGFDELDSYFKFLPEQLYLLSAPTHQGKTTLALNMAARIATTGERVLFASLEQGVFVAPRVESMLSGRFPESLSILTTYRRASIKGLIDQIHGMDEKPRIVFIDHLHFIKKPGRGATEDLEEIIQQTQDMAKELQIPVLVVAHVRKLNADRPPELDDLKDSSSLSQTPSVILLLHRKKNEEQYMSNSYLSNNGALLIAKNRIMGRSGVIRFTLQNSGEFIFNKYE